MFAGCIISRSGTASKYGWRAASPEPYTRC